MAHFEQHAFINSIKNCFPRTNIVGCYIHLTANIWKHVPNGLRKAHKTSNEFKKYYKTNFAVFSTKETNKFVQ